MSEPLTKQDLLDAESRILSTVKALMLDAESRIVSTLRGYVLEAESRTVSNLTAYVNERCEKVETSLLTEFHKWASPTEARQRTISAALRAIDLEMEALTDRVKKLEGNRPPHQ